MELKTELKSVEARAETWETLADEHASKMIMWKQKYEKLQKEMEES